MSLIAKGWRRAAAEQDSAADPFTAMGVEMTPWRGYFSFSHDVHARERDKGAVVKKLVETLVELIEDLVRPAPQPRPVPVRVKGRGAR